MKKCIKPGKLLFLVFILVAHFTMSAQNTISKKDALKEIRFLNRAIVKTHPRFIDKNADDSFLDSFYQKMEHIFPQKMTIQEYFQMIAPFYHSNFDAHTRIEYYYNFTASDSVLPPFKLAHTDGNKIMIKQSNIDSLAGMELVEMNGMKMDAIIKKLTPFIQGNHFSPNPISKILEFFPFFYSFAFPLHESYDLKLNNNTKDYELKISGVKEEIIQSLFYSNFFNRDNYYLEKTNDKYLVHIPSFMYQNKEIFAEFLEKTFKEIGNKAADVIINIQNNGGGSTDLVLELLSYITNKDKLYYGDAVSKRSKLRRKMLAKYTEESYINLFMKDLLRSNCIRHDSIEFTTKKRKKYLQNNYYFFVNQFTASAAVDLVTLVKNNNLGLVLGTNTAEYNQIAINAIPLTLPFSNLNATIATKYDYRGGRNVPKQIVSPDIFFDGDIKSLTNKLDSIIAKHHKKRKHSTNLNSTQNKHFKP